MQARKADSKTFKNRRMAEREHMHWLVTYTYEAGGSTYIVDGVTRDFCNIGCGIRGSIMPPTGSKTRLKVYLPNQKLPMSLDAKIAGWQETILASNFMNWIRRTICESVNT